MHHISKYKHDPMVEEREIGRRPKLPYRCISFVFQEVYDDDMLKALCALKSLRSVSSGVLEE